MLTSLALGMDLQGSRLVGLGQRLAQGLPGAICLSVCMSSRDMYVYTDVRNVYVCIYRYLHIMTVIFGARCRH